MNRKCLHCYQPLSDNEKDYHQTCVLSFFGQKAVPLLPYDFYDIEKLAKEVALQSIAVTGVQPKLSLGWMKDNMEDGHQGRLTIMNALDGKYILKPQNTTYPQMPENEHLSMKLAESFGINVVPHSMIRLRSGELCYITKRIDRTDNGDKIHMIDFMQITEIDDKNKGTMERLGKLIGEYSENVLLDKFRFFELAVLNYIIGNNDMHLKNFSMIERHNGWVFSPAYDLLNVKIILPKDRDDVALLLGGKKQNISKVYFDRLGENLQLNKKQINNVYKRLTAWRPKAEHLINTSFLIPELKQVYTEQVNEKILLFR